ncbi:MAG: SET domain-containing protein [Ignavibacteriales bacterium]|nr:SET domain-containing protein [Ignavibacteriales bacterium]
MENKTTEFSFVLNVSKINGVGVFATHAISKGTKLNLFWERGRSLKIVPKAFLKYCIEDGKQYACATNFGRMSVGWYLNHSKTPNAFHKNYLYFANRNIKVGEEILIDYDTL